MCESYRTSCPTALASDSLVCTGAKQVDWSAQIFGASSLSDDSFESVPRSERKATQCAKIRSDVVAPSNKSTRSVYRRVRTYLTLQDWTARWALLRFLADCLSPLLIRSKNENPRRQMNEIIRRGPSMIPAQCSRTH